MKKIECYLREADAQQVVDALAKTGISGVTVYPVSGFGRQRAKGKGVLMPKVKVEVLVLDLEIDQVLTTISQGARKGNFGDGKIAILPVDEIIRIRTGEKGAKAV